VLRACVDFLYSHTANGGYRIAEFKTARPNGSIAKRQSMQSASNLLVNFVAPASPVRGGESRMCDVMKDVALVQCSVQQQDRYRRQQRTGRPSTCATEMCVVQMTVPGRPDTLS
jgi:hypothetical protein